MTEPQQPRLWVRVVEAHAVRTWVALILAISAGLSIVILVTAGVVNVIANAAVTDLSSNFTAAISSTLGVLVGALATYVGNAPGPTSTRGSAEEFPKDDQLVLDLEQPPKEPPKPGPQC